VTLTATQLGFARGPHAVFSSIDFSLQQGGLMQVLGANGSGKSTLLRVLASLLPAAAGELRWDGRPVRAGDPDYLQSLAYVGHANGIAADLPAADSLTLAARLAGWVPKPGAVQVALATMGIGHASHMPARALSQGQRRRVALARLLLAPCALWLLDEPVAALDAEAEARFDAMLGRHLDNGGMAVVATHRPLARADCTVAIG